MLIISIKFDINSHKIYVLKLHCVWKSVSSNIPYFKKVITIQVKNVLSELIILKETF